MSLEELDLDDSIAQEDELKIQFLGTDTTENTIELIILSQYMFN